jgi:hypothetical protein
MPQNLNYSDELHTGSQTFQRIPVVPDASFGDAQMSAANPVTAPKLKHQYTPTHGQPHGVAAVTERKVIHVARAAGDVVACEAGVVVAGSGGGMSVTVDLRKNGTTVLTAVITLNAASTAYANTDGAISVGPYVAGDVFEIVITATAGGGTLPQGVFVDAVFREGAG